MSIIGNGIYAGGGGGGPIIYDMSLDNDGGFLITYASESLYDALIEDKCSIRLHLFSEYSSSLFLEYPLIHDLELLDLNYEVAVFRFLETTYTIYEFDSNCFEFSVYDKDDINGTIQMMYGNLGLPEESISIVGVSIVQYP